MTSQIDESPWDLGPAISLLNALVLPTCAADDCPSTNPPNPHANQYELTISANNGAPGCLGNFKSLWNYLGRPHAVQDIAHTVNPDGNNLLNARLDVERVNKGVRWRDELDGTDLAENDEIFRVDTAASIRTQQRAARRARAKAKVAKVEKVAARGPVPSDSGTDAESGGELESLRQSPDRTTIIASILGRPRPRDTDTGSPPTSPSPPKAEPRTLHKQSYTSNPFLWSTPQLNSPSSRFHIETRDGLSPRARKASLISKLSTRFPAEKSFLKNAGLLETAFTPLNVSTIGVHVFIDISNIMIGYHDCLKVARGISMETRIRRVPMCFHNLSLVLERGRPAAKRVLVGSDRFPIIQQAKQIGYETNILDRVHKLKEPTPRQKKFHSAGGANSGLETSGSETNTMAVVHEKWVEQGVDEILHLKIMETLVDANRPGTIVLATGDAAEAEYSGGFMRMVERALQKGWMVELVSFKLNTSSAYKRSEFRCKWGAMFKWVQLDEFVEQLIDEEEEEAM